MTGVKGRIAQWEARGKSRFTDDLKRFLDLAWSSRKSHVNGTYAAENTDIYALYARIGRTVGIGPAAVVKFLERLITFPILPEIQCSIDKSSDSLGKYLKKYFSATRAASGFTQLSRQNWQRLAVRAKADSERARPLRCPLLSRTFYHFRRSAAKSSHRVYLHVRPVQAINVMDYIVRDLVMKPVDHPGLTNAKVGAPDVEARSDTIVIYVSDEAEVQRVLTKIAAYQRGGKQSYFEHGTTRGTKHITDHKGVPLVGVGVGAEPPVALRRVGDYLVTIPYPSSFGSFRSELITHAVENTLDSGEGKAEFLDRVETYFRAAGIDPGRPHEHGMATELQHRATVTLRQLRNGEDPTWKIG